MFLFISRLSFPYYKCLNPYHLLSLICRVHFPPISFFCIPLFISLLSLNLSHNTETLSSHRHRIVTAGKYVCCLGLLCWILMSYQTLQEESFLFFLSGWFALLENRKWESPAAKKAFSGLSRGWVITEDIAAVIPRHGDRYISSQLMPLQRFHSNPIKYMTNT